MKNIKAETDGYMKNIFPDKENTYELLEYNMMEDLEKIITKYADIFAQLHLEANAMQEAYLYNDYALNSGTLPIQAMARIAYFFNKYLPLATEGCPNYKLWFLDGLVDIRNEHDQLNGEDIWKHLVELGEHLDRSKTLIGFISNDIGCALDAKNKREKNEPR